MHTCTHNVDCDMLQERVVSCPGVVHHTCMHTHIHMHTYDSGEHSVYCDALQERVVSCAGVVYHPAVGRNILLGELKCARAVLNSSKSEVRTHTCMHTYMYT
jgi:hypothetical protein